MIGTLRKTFSLVDRRTRWQAVGVCVITLATSALEGLGVGAIFPLLKIIAAPDAIPAMPVIGTVYGWLAPSDPRLFLVAATSAVLALFLMKAVIALGATWWQLKFSLNNEALLSARLMRAYLYAPYPLHLRRNSAELIRNVVDAVETVASGVLLSALGLATELLVVVMVGLVLLSLAPLVALCAVAVLVVAGGIYALMLRNRAARFGALGLYWQRQVLQTLQQAFGSVKEIKVLGREPHFDDGFVGIRLEQARLRRASVLLAQLPRFVTETLVGVIMMMAVLVVLFRSDAGDAIAVLGMFAVASLRLLPSVNRMMFAAHQIRLGEAAVDAVHGDFQLLEAAERPPASRSVLPFERELRLEDVCFAYEGSAHRAVDGISLTIRAGESIGLVGMSGSGKTTLADMVLGLLHPQSGRLLVDGADALARVWEWQGNLSYVPQTINLIDDSLKRNVAFGIPDDQIDEARLAEALRQARLEEVVARMPQGVDTPLGERGARLSGGQRQRVGIARALYRDPRLLVLDEATSALDSETEREVAEAIEGLKGSKTLLIIAHRLSTVRHCDRLVLLEQGRVAAMGSYAELLAGDERFRRLVSAELSAEGVP